MRRAQEISRAKVYRWYMAFGPLWETWRDECFGGYYVDCAADNRTAPSPAAGTGTHHHLPSRMAEASCE